MSYHLHSSLAFIVLVFAFCLLRYPHNRIEQTSNMKLHAQAPHYGSLPSITSHDGEQGSRLAPSSTTAAGRFNQTKSAAATLVVIGLAIIGFATFDADQGNITLKIPFLGQPKEESNSSPCDANDPSSPKSCAAFYTQHTALSVKPSTCPKGEKEVTLPPAWWPKCGNQLGAKIANCGNCKPPNEQAGGACFCEANGSTECTVANGYPGQNGSGEKTCPVQPCRESDHEAAGCVRLEDNCKFKSSGCVWVLLA